jgi:hypothetical protein
VKEPVPEKEREQVNRLKINLCPMRKPVLKKKRGQVNKLRNDLCPNVSFRRLHYNPINFVW